MIKTAVMGYGTIGPCDGDSGSKSMRDRRTGRAGDRAEVCAGSAEFRQPIADKVIHEFKFIEEDPRFRSVETMEV